MFDKRMRCYNIIFEVLDDLDCVEHELNPALGRLRQQTYELVYGSDDELFHQALYDWFVSRGQQERLLEVPTFQSHFLTSRSKHPLSKHTSNTKQPRPPSKPIFSGNSTPKTQITTMPPVFSMNSPTRISPFPSKKESSISPVLRIYVLFGSILG